MRTFDRSNQRNQDVPSFRRAAVASPTARRNRTAPEWSLAKGGDARPGGALSLRVSGTLERDAYPEDDRWGRDRGYRAAGARGPGQPRHGGPARATLGRTNSAPEIDGETLPLIYIEISSASHPFYTGEKRIMKTGAVDKFQARMKKHEEMNKKK